jgi:hypothetical protein
MQNLVDPNLPLESEVDSIDVVEPMQSLVNPTLLLESELNTTCVFFSSSNFSSQGVSPPMVTLPSPKFVSID